MTDSIQPPQPPTSPARPHTETGLPDLPDIALTTDYIFNKQLCLRQPETGYRFGTDAVMLAACIPAVGGRLLDMGAGVGAVSLGAAWRLPDLAITAAETEPDLVQLLKHNIALNQMDQRIRPLHADITNLPPVLNNSFDQVVANPPYHHPAGMRPSSRRRALAHIGDGPSLTDWVKAGLKALKPKGQLSFIIRADRGDEVITALRTNGAGEILQFPLWSYPSSPAIRLIITARKGVSGPSALLPGLVLHHADGSLTSECAQVMTGQGLALAHPARPKR